MSNLAWGIKVSPEFRVGVRRIAQDIGFDPSWLMSYIAFETGESFSASVKNPASGATGLIQFMPSTAIGLGTTVEELAKMSPEKQLAYVHEYFKPYKGKINTFSDGYMAILWPRAIGKPETYAIISDPESKAYIQNKGLDLNKDGNITKAEAASFPLARLDKGLQPDLATIEDREPRKETYVSEKPSILEGLGAVAGMLNPIAGIVFNAFSPLIKEKITKEVDRHTDTPGVGAAIADALNTAILGKAKDLTGRSDELEAAAVVIQPQNTVKLQQVEEAAVDATAERLKQLAPLLDKSMEYDRALWAAQVEGKNAASSRYIAEKQAGGWDMTPALIYMGGGTACILVLALLGAIVYQGTTGDREIDQGMIGLAGPILAIAIGVWREVFAYRFDGNKEASAQTQAVLNLSEAAKKG